MPGVKKTQRYTGRHNSIFFVACNRAHLILGVQYRVPYKRRLMAQGFSAEVPRGNYFSIKNVGAMSLHDF
jgi:hypothetical protein